MGTWPVSCPSEPQFPHLHGGHLPICPLRATVRVRSVDPQVLRTPAACGGSREEGWALSPGGRTGADASGWQREKARAEGLPRVLQAGGVGSSRFTDERLRLGPSALGLQCPLAQVPLGRTSFPIGTHAPAPGPEPGQAIA